MKLSLFLSHKGVSDAAFAKQIGTSRSLISRYRAGNRIPGRRIMCRIYLATQGAVAPNDFYDLPPLPKKEVTY